MMKRDIILLSVLTFLFFEILCCDSIKLFEIITRVVFQNTQSYPATNLNNGNDNTAYFSIFNM